MRVPPGLTGLTYTVATPAEISHGAGGVNPSLLNFPQPAFNGVKPSTVLLLSSSAWRAALPGRFGCTGGSSGTGHTTLVPQGAPEAYISVWSVNPATLNFGQESIYGATIPHVGSTYFLLQYAGPFGGPGCAGSQHPTSLDVLQSRQANLLNQLVNSVAPA